MVPSAAIPKQLLYGRYDTTNDHHLDPHSRSDMGQQRSILPQQCRQLQFLDRLVFSRHRHYTLD